jgi:transposase
VFGAVRPGTDQAFGLIMPEVSTAAMQIYFDEFAKTIPPDEHVAMFMDQAGWHGAKALVVPANMTLVPLPSYAPQLNPVERLWLHMKARYLSHRLHADYEAIRDAACEAWNKLLAETGRITSLCSYPWIMEVQI